MRHLECGLIELKLAPTEGDADTMTFTGYGAVFGNVDAYGDVIEPGAFASFLSDVQAGKQNWPAMLSQHGGYGMTADDMTPVGVWAELSEDGKGLKVTGQLANTERGRDLHTLMKMTPRPAINGLSIGYIPKEWEPRSKPDDPRRRIKKIDLIEISPVTFPANNRARVDSVKSADGIRVRDAENALREAGFSANEAKAILAEGFKTAMRDAGSDELAELCAAIERGNAALR
jgi:phage prohead protease, HK97 family